MLHTMIVIAALLGLSLTMTGCNSPSQPVQPKAAAAPALLNFTMEGLDGQPVHLTDYTGKVVLFVNVASKCGFTKQYPALEALYEKYKDRGLVLVGVPANNFGGQEPGTNAQIAEFCTTNYGVTFPMLAKIDVTGPDQCALYHALIDAAAANGLKETGPVKWNFEKFLLDRQGRLVARFRSPVKPDSAELTSAVEQALNG